MDFKGAFFDELKKVAQDALGQGIPLQQMQAMYRPAPMPPEPAYATQMPKLKKITAVGKRLGQTSLRIMDKLVRPPATSFSRPPSVPRSIL